MSENYLAKGRTINSADTSTTGVKLSYTSPAIPKRRAYVISATWRTETGTVPTVQLQLLTAAAATITLAQSDANGHIFIPGSSIVLMPGDTIQFNVTAAGAASTGDGMLSVDEVA